MSGKILPKSQKPRKTHFRTHYILAFPSPSHGKDEKAKRRLEKKVGIRVHALTHMKHIMHMKHMKHMKHESLVPALSTESASNFIFDISIKRQLYLFRYLNIILMKQS